MEKYNISADPRVTQLSDAVACNFMDFGLSGGDTRRDSSYTCSVEIYLKIRCPEGSSIGIDTRADRKGGGGGKDYRIRVQ